MEPDLNEALQAGGTDPSGPTAAERSAENLLAECLALSESDWGRAIRDACDRRPDLAAPLEHLFRNVHAMNLVLRPTDFGVGASDELPMPATLGDFQLLERVGGGGMGVVYRARQVSLNRTVALKLIRPEHLFFEKSKERFRREAEAISRLHHPGIVPLFQAGEENKLPYLAMEFIEGQSLATILSAVRFRDPAKLKATDFSLAYRQGSDRDVEFSDEGIFSKLESRSWAALCCRIVARVAHALEHAHRNGVVHRDIKPSNIMITPDGHVVVVDFGLAISEGAASLTRTGSHPGSLPYMSPEQIAGLPVDLRTDLYSLGVTLYELLTLRCPFPTSSPDVARRRIAAGAFDRLHSRNRSVSLEVEAVCFKAMERDRESRYSSAAEFAEDLANAVTHRAIRAQRFGLGRRCLRLSRRHPARTLAACALFLAVCVGPLLFAWQQHSHAANLAAEQETTRAALIRAQSSAEEASAASDFLKEMVDRANPLNSGKPDVTVREALLASATVLEKRFVNAPNALIRLLTVAGCWCDNVGAFDESARFLERARELVQAHSGPSDFRLSTILVALSQRRPPAEAEAMAREAIRICEQQPQPDHMHMCEAYDRLSAVQCLAGSYSEAEESCRKAIIRANAAIAALASDNPVLAILRRNIVIYHAHLADLLRVRGAMTEARRLALSTLDSARAELGPTDSGILKVLSVLHEIDFGLGDMTAAEGWALDAERISTSVFGPDHREVLRARMMLFQSRQDSGRPLPSAAEVHAVVSAMRRLCGDAAEFYHWAALIECHLVAMRGDLAESRELAARLVETMSKYGLDTNQRGVGALVHLSEMRFRLGDVDGALADGIRASALAQTINDKARAEMLVSGCHVTRGDFAAGEEAARKARLRLELTCQSPRPASVMAMQAEAAALWRQGRFVEAEALIKQSLRTAHDLSLNSRMSMPTAEAYSELGNLYFTWGKLDEAVQAWEAVSKEARSHRSPDLAIVVAERRLLQLKLLAGHVVSNDDVSRAAPPAAGDGDVRDCDGKYLSALMHMNRGDHERAHLLMKEAQEDRRVSRRSALTSAGQMELDSARIAYAAADYSTAERMVGDALTRIEAQRGRPAWMRERARVFLARCLLREEEVDQARTLLDQVEVACRSEANQAWALVRKDLEIARAEERAVASSADTKR